MTRVLKQAPYAPHIKVKRVVSAFPLISAIERNCADCLNFCFLAPGDILQRRAISGANEAFPKSRGSDLLQRAKLLIPKQSSSMSGRRFLAPFIAESR